MRKTIVGCTAIAFILLSGLAPVPVAISQEVAGMAGDDAGQELESSARGLVVAIGEKRDELSRLSEQISTTTGDDQKALRERAIELIDEYLTDIGALATNIVDREKAGLDAGEDRQMVTDLAQRTSVRLQDEVKNSQNELAKLRTATEGASPEEMEEIGRDLVVGNVWLDRILDMFLKHTLGIEAFGLDVGAQREFLSDNLTQRGELVSGRIMLGMERLEKIERRLKADPSSAQFNADLDVANERLDRLVDRLVLTTRLMEALDLDTADYQQLLFQVTGEITTGLFSREVISGLFKGWAESVFDWLAHNGPTVILRIVLFGLILFVFRILSKIARKIVKKAIEKSGLAVSTLLERTALSVTGSLVWIFGLLVALSQLGFQVGPLLAGLGVVGFIVGFALQDTLSNFASGVMILLYRPFDVGDLIETAGAIGKVENMTLVSTTILTVDHQTLVIPNSMIWGNVIKNVTAQTKRRVDMVFGIGYSDDIPHAERVLGEILTAHEKVLEDPEPVVKLHTLGESSVDFVVRPWAKTDDYWDVYWDVTREVKMRFDAEGISIPFPQRDVHVFQEGGDGGE